MGGELVTGSPSQEGDGPTKESVPHLSYTEQFYQQLQFYLAIGMTWDQYWNEDCMLVKYYREAYKLRRKERNHDLWLQGLYIYHALCDASPLFRFSTKSQKAEPYLNEPIAITQEEVRERQERDERNRFMKMKEKMEAMVTKTKKQEVKEHGTG